MALPPLAVVATTVSIAVVATTTTNPPWNPQSGPPPWKCPPWRQRDLGITTSTVKPYQRPHREAMGNSSWPEDETSPMCPYGWLDGPRHWQDLGHHRGTAQPRPHHRAEPRHRCDPVVTLMVKSNRRRNSRGGDDLAELGKWWRRNPSRGGELAGLGICDGGKWVGWNHSPINRVARVCLPIVALHICGHGYLVYVVGPDGAQSG
jgi:hypothetical protein